MALDIPVLKIDLVDPDNGQHGYFYGVRITRYRIADGSVCNIVARDYYHTTPSDEAITDLLDLCNNGKLGAL